MLSGRLTGIVLTGVLMLGACGGGDDGSIRDNVVEPGITAMDDATVNACGSEASSFRTALETYEVLEGEPPPDEQALIDRGLLRNESELWDVVDGRLVPQDPGCGDVATTVPTADIVTDEDAANVLTVDGVLATFTAAEVASVGGSACARELAVLIAAASRYSEREGADPRSLDDVEAAGDLSEPVTMWEVDDDVLRPAAGSSCVDFVAAEAAELCRVEVRTLDVAREAYVAEFGSEPTHQDLIDGGVIRGPEPGDTVAVELIDGKPRPVPGGPCDGIDLTQVPTRTPSDSSSCDTDRRTLEVAIEAYIIATGEPPAVEEDLVAAEMLRTVSPTYDLEPGGEIVPAAGRGCD